MSGIEVAGLVLGAFPVLVWCCQKYKDVFADLDEWQGFEDRFEDFAITLETERHCYRNTLIALLCRGSNPFFQRSEDASQILDDPVHATWRSAALEDNLRQRLDDKFEVINAIMRKLNRTATELYRLLDIQRGQRGANRWNKVKFDDNQDRTWRQEKLQRIKFSFSSKRFEKLAQFKMLNENFNKLVSADNEFYKLKTTAAPSALISVLRKVRESACGLHRAMRSAWTCSCTNRHTTRLRLEKRSDGNAAFLLCFHGPNAWGRHMKVQVSDSLFNKTPSRPKSAKKAVSFVDPTLEDPISSQLEHTDKRNSANKNPGPGIPTHKSSSHEPFKLGIRSKLRTSSLYPKAVDQPASTPSASRLGLHPESQTVAHIPIKTYQETVGEIAGSPPKYVTDLCQAVCSTSCPKVSYIIDSDKEYQFQEVAYMAKQKATTLKTMLTNGSLKRRQRIRIASTLAASLLQLEKTPWTTRGWSKDEVWLLQGADGSINSDSPFFTQEFESTKLESGDESYRTSSVEVESEFTTANSPFDTTLIRFGIMLLELCFGETIESRLQKTSLGGGESDQRRKLFEYTAAWEWSAELPDEFPEFKPLVDRCLKEQFGERIDWEDIQFLQRVYANLVKPLSEIVVSNGWDTT